MTKVSKEILHHIQQMLDIPVYHRLHPLLKELVELLAKLVGSDEGIIETVIALEMRIKKLESKIIENELQNR